MWLGDLRWQGGGNRYGGFTTFVYLGQEREGSIVWLGDLRWRSGGVPGAFIWPGQGGSKVVVGEQDGGRAFIGFGSESGVGSIWRIP